MITKQNLPIYDETQEHVDAQAIEASPFYKNGMTVLPVGQPVYPGGFYVDNNSGGIITQISIPTNPDSQLPKGRIDLEQRVATVHAGHIADVISYKGQVGDDPVPSNWVQLGASNGSFKITNLIEKNYEPLGDINPERFVVNKGTDEAFSLYSVRDENGQLYIVHSIEPEAVDGGQTTKTEMHGLVYVEYKQTVYIGQLEGLSMLIDDPKGAFRE